MKLLAVVYIAGLCGAAASYLYNSIQMTRSILPDPPNRPKRFYNRFNVIFYPADLTPRGRRYRANVFISIFLFLGLLWLGPVLMAMGWWPR